MSSLHAFLALVAVVACAVLLRPDWALFLVPLPIAAALAHIITRRMDRPR